MTRLPKPLLAAALVLPALAPAETAFAGHIARYDVRIGIGDQNREMFDARAFQRTKMRQVRYFVPYNAIHERDERLKARRWVKAARREGLRPFLHVSTDNIGIKEGALPSVRHYRKDVGRLVRYFRRLGVRDFGTWNEANHKSQPTYDNPYRAGRFFKEMRRAVFSTCSARSCRVVGLDVLDQRGVERYIRRWMNGVGVSYARRYLRVVGIHNYSDVNRERTSGMRNIMRTIRRYTRRPNFWLTETGGIVKFGRSFPCDEERAADRLSHLFRIARRYRKDLQRIYLYNWTGTDCASRFDAGLTRADGSPRPGYHRVRTHLRRFER